jgi:NAD(P)-dependent dehydrogenase (short-subunit alcohol dehydrogenase family)
VLADPQTVRKLVPAAAAFAPLTLLVNNASEIETDDIATLERARLGRQSDGAVVSGAALCLAARAPMPRSSISPTSACSSRRRGFSPTP